MRHQAILYLKARLQPPGGAKDYWVLISKNRFIVVLTEDSDEAHISPQSTILESVPPVATFDGMGLRDTLLRGIYARGFDRPSSLQQVGLSAWAQGLNVLAWDRKWGTGEGKTTMLDIGVLQRIDLAESALQALVLTPTREMAAQLAHQLTTLSTFEGVKSVCFTGGSETRVQLGQLQEGVQVLVSTPGRTMDLIQRKVIDCSKLLPDFFFQ
jgi:superfamily II DNA/RNA helicase